MKTNRNVGLLMIISAATLWGLSGPLIQWLFQHTELTSGDYLVVRLLSAGILILGFLVFKKQNIFEIWKHPKDWIQLILFALLGMLGAQYVFIETVRISNAVTATLFQFLGPVLITIFVAFQTKRIPSMFQHVAIVTALTGIYLLITDGSVSNIILSDLALIFGILTAVGFAFYTLQPKVILDKWGAVLTVGWGMLIGGLFFYLSNQEFSFRQMATNLTSDTFMLLVLIIMIGTLSFVLYIGSLKHLSATETSLLSSIEPLVAAIVSMTWLNQSFGIFQLIGGFFIVVSVILLSLPERLRISKRRDYGRNTSI